jgi:hypothetical protein
MMPVNSPIGGRPVPGSCHSILVARWEGELATDANADSAANRQLPSQQGEKSPEGAPTKPLLVSDLAMVGLQKDRLTAFALR